MTKTTLKPLPKTMQQWVMKSRPQGVATYDNFEWQTVPIPTIDEGELLIKTLYLGVAPVMLRYMTNDTTFERPMAIGDVMMGRGVGVVVESKHPNYRIGDRLQAKLRWREYAVVNGNDPYFLIYKIQNTDLPASYGIGAVAMTGFTGLIGMREVCQVKAGDKVLVSGAAGGVGSHAGFIAKALGTGQVVGIAGGSEKCRLLVGKLGYDAAIDYKNEDIAAKLTEFFPEGIDVFFDNVGGAMLDEVMGRIRNRGRIAICGSISEYLKSPEERHRFQNIHWLGRQSAKLESFFVYDYTAHFGGYEDQLAAWIRAGKLKPLEHVLVGLEQMPAALMSLFNSGNLGVLMVRI
jgi:NADPH-dependent curcumin reductase